MLFSSLCLPICPSVNRHRYSVAVFFQARIFAVYVRSALFNVPPMSSASNHKYCTRRLVNTVILYLFTCNRISVFWNIFHMKVHFKSRLEGSQQYIFDTAVAKIMARIPNSFDKRILKPQPFFSCPSASEVTGDKLAWIWKGTSTTTSAVRQCQ